MLTGQLCCQHNKVTLPSGQKLISLYYNLPILVFFLFFIEACYVERANVSDQQGYI